MRRHAPSAPSPDPDAFLVDASAVFRDHLAAFQRLAGALGEMDNSAAGRAAAEIAALEREAEHRLADIRRLAIDIIDTPACGCRGRAAKAAALQAYLERTGGGVSLETDWALSLAEDELRHLEHQPWREPKPVPFAGGAAGAVGAVRQIVRDIRRAAVKRLPRRSAFVGAQAGFPASGRGSAKNAAGSAHSPLACRRSQTPPSEWGRNPEERPHDV